MQRSGYRVDLVFFWLPSAETAIARVASRVASGGHDIPEDVIRRRYARGLQNLLSLYIPVADLWSVYDNSQRGGYELIVSGGVIDAVDVRQPEIWCVLQESIA